MDDEFDMEMAKTEEDKLLAANARASKMWRTLRVASKSKLNLFDRIDDGNNIQVLFQPDGDENKNKGDINGLDLQGKDSPPPETESISQREDTIEILQDISVK